MGFDVEKRFATELGRLLDTGRKLELDQRAQARRAEERREQLRRLLDEMTRSYDGAELEASPGKQSLVREARRLLREVERAPRRTRDAFARPPWQPRGETFDDYRVSGLLDVLARVPDETLRRSTLAAADPAIASRVPGDPAPSVGAGGHALWRAAERRAASVYRQAQQAGTAPGEDPIVDEALARIGAGQPLPDAVREGLAEELGMAFDRVRIHTDGVAAAAARALNASAFTVGEDIFFAEGCYAPDTRSGRKLLAHELWHVVQGYQGRTARTAGISISHPGDALETEAAEIAERVERGDGARARSGAEGAAADRTAPLGGSRHPPAPRASAGGAMLLRDPDRRTQEPRPTAGDEHATDEAGAEHGDSSDPSVAPGARVRYTPAHPAPHETPNRTRVGVGEAINFTADRPGTWQASADRWNERRGTGTSYQWTAPGRPGTATVTYTPRGGGARQTFTFEVIAPNSVSFHKVRDFSRETSAPPWRHAPLPGMIRAGMELRVTLMPLDVSFAGVFFMEGAVDGSHRSGFWSTETPDSHDASMQWFAIGPGNVLSERDTASYANVPARGQDGYFQWVIPNRWSLEQTGAGTELPNPSFQRFYLGGDYTLRITKNAAGGEMASVTGGLNGGPDPAAVEADRARRGHDTGGHGGGHGRGDVGAGSATTTNKQAQSGAGAADTAGPEDRGGRRLKGSAPKPKQEASSAASAGTKPSAGTPKTAAGSGAGQHAFGGGGIDGSPLKQQLNTFNQLVDQHTATVKQPEGTDGSPKKESGEDHEKKVAQYEDGVDGIADMIGDTDGFDEICEGFSAFGDDRAKQQSGLAKVRQTKAFGQLAKMWQGALDGGQDSARMQAAYERQFSARGFWGSTEQAFNLVKEDAKRQAREDAEAAAAKKRARDAAANAKEKAAAQADAAANTAAGTGTPQTVHGGQAGGANAAFLNAAVSPKAAPLTQVLAMAKDAEFKATLASVDHHTELVMSAQQEDTQARRRDQIWEQLKRAGGGFKEGFWETAKWGIIAHAGNKLAGGAIEKLVGEKVPVIGPIIMLALDPPWKGEYWHDVGKGFSKGAHQIASLVDLTPFEHCHEPMDYVGVICAKLADLFGGFYQILTTINRLLGTLSALALILGAVLIGVGCALAWLGVGAGLIAAGGWLVEAGEVLGDISLALMPVCLALSAISLVFRTAAAYWVPADLYADQLVAEGDAADKFGNQAGQRVGLATARAVEEATPIEEKPPTVKEGGGSSGHGDAHAEAAKVAETSKAAGDAMTEAGKGAGETNKPAPERKPEAQEHKADEHAAPKTESAEAKPEQKAQEHKADEHAGKKGKGHEEKAGEREQGKTREKKAGEHEESKTADEAKQPKEGGEEHAKSAEAKKSVGRRFVESLKAQLKTAIKGSVQLGKNIERLGDSLGDARELFSREATDRGLATRSEVFEERAPKFESKLEKLNEHVEELGKTAEAADAKFKEAYDKLMAEDGKLTLEQEADLRQQLDDAAKASAEAEKSIRKAQKKIEVLKDALETFERAEQGAEQDRMPTEEERHGSAAEDNGADPHSNAKRQSKAEAARKQARAELVEAKVERTRLETELETAETRLRQARREQREAERTVEDMEADPTNAKKVEASERVAKHEAQLEKARELDRKAGEIERNDHKYRKTQKALERTVGKTVEIDGASHKIVGFGPDGVVVEPAGGGPRRSVAPDAVKGDLPGDFAKQVETLNTAKANLARLTEGEPGGNPGGVAANMHARANGIRSSERTNYSSPKKQARWADTKKTAREWEAEKSAVSDPAARELESAQRELETKQKAVGENEQHQKDLEKTIAENDACADAARRARGDHRRVEKALEKGFEIILHLANFDRLTDALLKVTGLQARIDSLKEMIGWHVEKEEESSGHGAGYEGGTEEAKREGEEHAAAAKKEDEEQGEGGEENAAAEPAKGEEGKEGEEHEGEGEHAFERRWYNEREEVEHEAEAEVEEAREEAKHAGAEEQHFEELLALRPPPDVVLLAGYRERAADAAARHTKAHAQAYRAYQAELAVTRLAEESKAMAESGKPIHKRAQGMKGPIEKSKSDEAQRKSKLDGNDTGDVKGADSKMGGLVVDLISKLADNSDHLSQRPDGGGVKGDDMAGSQDKAASEGKERTEQSKSHSSSQQQFLDQALQVRAQQEASVAQNIQSLEGKSREEFAIRDEIRVQKAQALAEEAAARDEAESNAAQFNEGYARAAAWAETYEAKRKEKSSGGAE